MKTAMEQLWEYIDANYNEENFNIFNAKTKSLELEKQQIIDAYEDGDSTGDSGSGKNYYNKTYGSK